MRSEKEIIDLILKVANTDERVRAVYMNGSKTNPTIEKDVYQDYDIVYVVTETQWFIENGDWVKVFGTPFMIQEPDSNDFGWGSVSTDRYAWLVLFDDGNRIDLTIQTKQEAKVRFVEDKLTVLLMDKDKFLPQIMPSTDVDYHVQKPTLQTYKGCCNEFWWCLNNVAKGIARDELPYAMQMYNHHVRDMLNLMVEWQIGIGTNFSVSAGKMGKFYKKYLSDEFYHMYANTYSNSDYENFWESIFVACELFRRIAINVSDTFGYCYNMDDDKNMMKYLNNVKQRVYEE